MYATLSYLTLPLLFFTIRESKAKLFQEVLPMTEPVSVFIDQFQLNTSPYGATLNFMLTDPMPPSPGTPPKSERQATVRMSLEHMKVMAFIMQRSVKQYEAQTGTTIQIPMQMLNSMGISLEDWDACWKRD